MIHQKLDRYIPLVNEFIEALNQLNPQQQFESWSKELFHLLTNESGNRDFDKLQSHLNQFKEKFFIDLNQSDEPYLTPRTTQENLTNEGEDSSINTSKITSIRILFKNAVEKEINDLFGKEGELFASLSLGDVRLALGNVSLKLKHIIQDKTNINDYSTWFSSTFRQQTRLLVLDKTSIRELEIPGQYTSKRNLY